jgi:hypothetical protein
MPFTISYRLSGRTDGQRADEFSAYKRLVAGPDLPESLHPERREAGAEDGEGLEVLSVVRVEWHFGEEVDVGAHRIEVFQLLGQFFGLAGEEFAQAVDGAAAAFVDVVEHAEHVVAALEEEEVEDGQRPQHEALLAVLPLQVEADLPHVPRLVHQLTHRHPLLLHHLLLPLLCAGISQPQQLAHRRCLFHEVDLENLLKSGLNGGLVTRWRMSLPSRSYLLNFLQR